MALGEQFDAILPAAQRGEAWAFDALYRHFAPAVTGYLRLQGSEDPEDLANEVFLGVFRALSSFSGGEAALRSWVFSIAHRRMIDERRRRGRRVSTAPLDDTGGYESTGRGTEDEAIDALNTERLLRLCNRLAPDQRDVILLRLVSDLSVEQTASALGKRPGAVKALQRRALESLRKALAKEILRKGVSE
ncbi:MAG: RNA polymerase sigma factor [Acidimicrobiales bacterium]